jgi:hypothetical protein
MIVGEAVESALLIHAKARTETVIAKVRGALAAIELDIEQNEGIYPYNGGRLTQAEVCRRAGIHKVTLQGGPHRTTTREMIEVWLKAVRIRLVTGKKMVRKSVTARADDWKERYLNAARMSHLYHNQMVALAEERDQGRVRIAELEAEVLKLRSELSNGKVVQLRNT